MNNREIEHMISLADDKYIDELFERQVYERRKNPAVWFGTAAAVLVAAAGIGSALSMKDSEDAVGLQSIVLETTFTEYSPDSADDEIYTDYSPVSADDGIYTDYSPVSADDGIYTDYSEYFKCDIAALRMVDFVLDAGGEAYKFSGNYAHIENYSTSDITVYCDESGTAVNSFMRIGKDADDEESSKSVNLIMNYEGNYSPVLNAEMCTPVKWNGVDIYGFDLSDTRTDNELQAYFLADGTAYSMEFYNMDYSEAMEMIDRFIRQDFPIESSEAVKELEEFEQALKSSYPELEYPVGSAEISAGYYYCMRTAEGTISHKGVDFMTEVGTPVYAAAGGVVETAVNDDDVYGISVKLSHVGGMNTFYGCLSELAVSEGDTVRAGDLIGYSGNSGKSTGPHLHFEVSIGGGQVDPMDYLKTE